MPPQESSIPFDIGHVLFIDIVGYSKLLINEQSEQLETLRQIVRGTEQFKTAEAENKLQRLPTGDGGALVFRTNPEAPLLCAMEISRALKEHPQLRVRMGIHSGPVNQIADLNDQANVAGAGVNIAQRIMDCGDAGHILASRRVADDLAPYPKWHRFLHRLGACEVKHGETVELVNFFTDEVGNANPPQKCQSTTAAALPAGRPGDSAQSNIGKVAMGVIALLVIGIPIGVFILSHQSGRARQAQSTSSPVANRKSIAVLPFENLSGDPNNVYFADGIQEEILTRLSKISALKVISRTSTQRYKSAPDNLRDIAQQLGVANILEGTVQKAADQVRVNVQLIKAADDSQLWSEKYDRKLTDIFAVESEIATSIAAALKATLSGAEQKAITIRPTENSEAHQLYLKGRYYWNKRFEEGLKKAADYFQQSLDADPNYALAYVGLADSYALLGFHGYGSIAPNEAMPRAKAAAEKALQIDDTLGEAHASLGSIKDNYDWDLLGAEEEFKRAIQLNPSYATAHQWYGLQLTKMQRYPEAIAQMEQAQGFDPFSMIIHVNKAWASYFARQYDKTIDDCHKGLELDPHYPGIHWMLAQAYREKRLYAQAIAEMHEALRLSGNDKVARAVLAHTYAVAGKRDEAEKIIDELKELSKHRYFPSYFIALTYVGLNDKEQAFQWLEKAFTERSALTFLSTEPMFDPVRADPRFKDLLHRVGLNR